MGAIILVIVILYILESAIEKVNWTYVAMIVLGLPVLFIFIKNIVKLVKNNSRREITHIHEIKLPDLPTTIQPITGSFTCKSCGAKTILSNETNPRPICCYCGANLEDLEQLIRDAHAELKKERERNIKQSNNNRIWL